MGGVPGLDDAEFQWADASSIVGDAKQQQVVRVGWSRIGVDGGSSSSGGASSTSGNSGSGDAAAEVGVLVLARPAKQNAWDAAMFAQWRRGVALLAARDTIRAVLLCAEGRAFSAGLDLSLLASTFARYGGGAGGGSSSSNDASAAAACPARQRRRFEIDIAAMQEAYAALERQPWPVIAAVHGACVGAGVDLATACDLRFASADAFFCVKEVDVAIAADLGTLQRLPAIVGHGTAADMALTARRVGAREAAALGLVSRCLETPADAVRAALRAARDIAAKPPLAVWGTKRTLLHTRDAPGGAGAAGLERVALHNAAFLLSADIAEVVAAQRSGRPPRFSKL